MKLSAFFSLGILASMISGPLGCGDSGSGGSSSSQQSCESFHECTNGVCECTTEEKDGQSCEEEDCEDDCEVCS
mgnify:CR=1 FL=1